jgi:hypothetical protein
VISFGFSARHWIRQQVVAMRKLKGCLGFHHKGSAVVDASIQTTDNLFNPNL